MLFLSDEKECRCELKALEMSKIIAQLIDIEGIAIPEEAVSIWPMVGLIVAGGILLIGLIVALIYFIRKDAKTSKVKVSAQRVAVQKFDVLASVAQERAPNSFMQEVSRVLEDFLQERYQDRFRYETADEFIARLSQGEGASLPVSKREQLAEFVEIAEEIKFGLPPNAESMKLPLLAQAREIVGA